MITEKIKEEYFYLRDKIIEHFYGHLNDKQKEAVLFGKGCGLVLACPGSGKTTILIHRVHYLITFGPIYQTPLIPKDLSAHTLKYMKIFLKNPHNAMDPKTKDLMMYYRIHPENILSVTFSNASAKDMKERFYGKFRSLVGNSIQFSTIHRFALSVIRKYSYMYKMEFTILEGDRSPVHKAGLLKQFYHQVNKDYINEDKLEELSNAIGFVKNMMIKPSHFSNYPIEIENFDQIYILYEKYKREHSLIDFDDMLSLAYKILKNDGNLLNKYRYQYQYIQVDEAQDTSRLQHALIYLLASPKNNILMVADDDQSIYGFRGAFPEALLKFDTIYRGSKTFFIEENYRSSKDIVSVTNGFIQFNQERYPKKLFTENKNTQPIDLIRLNDEKRQTSFILEKLKGAQKLSDTAILFRNNISAIPLVEALERNNIPFYMRGFNMSFFKHWVVQDILSFFDVALNPYDTESFERIYYKMNGYIPKAAINHIRSSHDGWSVFDHLLSYPGFKEYQLKNLKRLKTDFENLSKKTPQEAIAFIENDLEYKKHLKSNCQKLKYSYDHIGLILSHLKSIAANTTTIITFMERLHELQNIIEASKFNKNKNALVLSTVHSAKGLEFEQVYMIDLVDGQFPTKNSIDSFEGGDAKALEEERRLFYVAMTRAKERLYLLQIDFKDGSRVKSSRFIPEVIQCMKDFDPEKYREVGSAISKSLAYSKATQLHKPTHDFSMGSPVIHQTFGPGIVHTINQDIIQIQFDGIGLRNLSISTCLDQKILKGL